MFFNEFNINMNAIGVQLGYNWGTIWVKKEAK